ncbi:hypothetical protein F4141_02095 [Candidatus Poribacteria bacterium]|nr:hypothetical protein [Candidatus Poribacteria bacterium]MYH79484.1 hypothetical protein [Candidatus Poribacteria bacterium]
MRTIQKIIAALPNLSTDELRYIERVIHDLYQARHETIIYDDDYGVWTEWDQNSVAAEVFDLIDKTEN